MESAEPTNNSKRVRMIIKIVFFIDKLLMSWPRKQKHPTFPSGETQNSSFLPPKTKFLNTFFRIENFFYSKTIYFYTSGDFWHPTQQISKNLPRISHIVIKTFVKLGDFCHLSKGICLKDWTQT
jgi:hypothetical protein